MLIGLPYLILHFFLASFSFDMLMFIPLLPPPPCVREGFLTLLFRALTGHCMLKGFWVLCPVHCSLGETTYIFFFFSLLI